MHHHRRTALLLCLLMLNSGCLGLFGNEDNQIEEVDCQSQPEHPECFTDVVTEEDCTTQQIFTGDACRLMIPPSELTYGVDEITLIVDSEMQALTPSFQGDGPQNWFVNPRLPDGLILDYSGEISGTPLGVSEPILHTVTATNAMGSSTTTIEITVLDPAPLSIQYITDTLTCTLDSVCSIDPPLVQGSSADTWSAEPPLPQGLELLEDGSILGTARALGDSNHSIYASNSGGSVDTTLRIITLHQAPNSLSYPGHPFYWTIDEYVQTTPTYDGGLATHWSVEPPLPPGIILSQEDGSLRGTPSAVYPLREYVISAQNTGGSISTSILIDVRDLVVEDLRYDPYILDLRKGENIGKISPTWQGGTPDTWEVNPPLPYGIELDIYTGEISGVANLLQPWSHHTIWANNSGGIASTTLQIRVTSMPPDQISWPNDQYALESNVSVNITVTNLGPSIETWEADPDLPTGLTLHSDGNISGIPSQRSEWKQYTIWANNTGGSVGLLLWIAVHDLRADQSDLLLGMGETNWGGWPSPILPIGEWAFPIGFAQEGYGSTIPVISASHVGRGKMLGYGHESWVDGAGAAETEFSLRAVEWVCGENADVGLAYGAGFDNFEDELQAEGHTVHLSVTPADLSGLDCLLDEFWNGHDNQDNQNLIDFVLEGGGLIMGGHAWYWSYSNSDVAHNYPGNKIAKTTGLFVSQAWGYNEVDLSEMPHELTRPHAAIQAIRGDRLDNQSLSAAEATIADATLSVCTGVVSLDFHTFWSPLRETVNSTGWTVIEYGTLWQNVGHNMGEDPVADTLLRVEAALTQGLPANELQPHPSHTEFPGEVPANATRITRTVTIDGNQSGLPSNFGYAGARAHVRMSTGLYAAPGDIVTVSLPNHTVDSGAYVLVGAHSDNLWSKSQLHRHPQIVRWWYINHQTMQVGNAFGGPIYIAIEPGSALGDLQVTISNAVKAPMFVLGETSDFEWIYSESENPAPWAELVSNNFIMTVPSHEIRDLSNPTELMEWWDLALEMEHDLYGYLPWPRVERAVFDAQISAGWMHSGYPFMAHDLSVDGVVNVTHMSENGDWGMFHELGHNHQWMPSTLPGTTETSCNFASVHLMEDLVGVEGHGAVDPQQRASRMRDYFDDGSNITNWTVWTALDTYLIIKEEWNWTPITQALSVYYTLPSSEVPTNGDEEFNAWVLHLSNATGYNLAPYHAAWGFPLTQATFDSLEHLPVWVDDPLRGDFFVYDSILRNLSSPDPSDATSTTISWETYDNGTNTTLMFYYGTADMGNQTSGWYGSTSFGSATVGNHSQIITGLTCCGTTYYGRIQATNEEGSVWFGPISWTTDYLDD
ncbi:MAG: M60 family metallopeptidase [Candidatus Thermoplasmatota archaeon]|nr:M60 family metallopeptidase [Candidatus Thermoplasmatota archaeon]